MNMDTDQLIRTLAASPRRPVPSPEAAWWCAAALAVASAAAVFFALLGPRPDIGLAAQTPQFLFKLVVTIALAGAAFAIARPLSRPGGNWRKLVPGLAIAPILTLVAVGAELLLVPPDFWAARAIGNNAVVCLTSIPLIALGPLAVFLLALRHGAPTCPVRAGAVAGLLAGAIAAIFYAAHCTDDSPLFVAVWYALAIAGVALLGAAAGGRFIRW